MENKVTITKIGDIRFKAMKIGHIYVFPVTYATRISKAKVWAVALPDATIITDEYDKWFLAFENLVTELQNAIGKTVEYVEVVATAYQVDEVTVVTWDDMYRIAVRRLISLGFE